MKRARLRLVYPIILLVVTLAVWLFHGESDECEYAGVGGARLFPCRWKVSENR